MAEPDEPFQVIWSERNRLIVRNLGKTAIERGLGKQFIDEIRHIEGQLRRDPLDRRDPHFRLRSTGQTVCHGIRGLAHVYYAVNEDERLWLLKYLLPLAKRGLECGRFESAQ